MTLSLSHAHTHTHTLTHTILSHTHTRSHTRTHTNHHRHRNQIMNRQQLYSPVKLKTVGTETKTHLKVIKLYKRYFFLKSATPLSLKTQSFHPTVLICISIWSHRELIMFLFLPSRQQSQKQKSQTVASCQDHLLKFYSQRKMHLCKNTKLNTNLFFFFPFLFSSKPQQQQQYPTTVNRLTEKKASFQHQHSVRGHNLFTPFSHSGAPSLFP